MLYTASLGEMALGEVPNLPDVVGNGSGLVVYGYVAMAKSEATTSTSGFSGFNFSLVGRTAAEALARANTDYFYTTSARITATMWRAGYTSYSITASANLRIFDYWVDTSPVSGNWQNTEIEPGIWVNTTPPDWSN